MSLYTCHSFACSYCSLSPFTLFPICNISIIHFPPLSLLNFLITSSIINSYVFILYSLFDYVIYLYVLYVYYLVPVVVVTLTVFGFPYFCLICCNDCILLSYSVTLVFSFYYVYLADYYLMKVTILYSFAFNYYCCWLIAVNPWLRPVPLLFDA